MFSSNRKGRFDLYRKAVDSVGAEELLYADDLNKRPTSWMACLSSESQRLEVYVTPFRQVSTAGAADSRPRWRQDGREIFYVTPDGQLMAAEVAIKGATLEVGAIRPLFSLGNASAAFDVSILILKCPQRATW